MARKRKVVKRVYESGRETTVISAKKKSSLIRRIRQPSSLKKIPPRQAPSPKSTKHPIDRIIKSSFRPALDEPAPDRKPFVDSYELPSSYNTTHIKLLVKDPFWIYAYWEISPDSVATPGDKLSKESIENARVVLRMYDVTLKEFDGSNANHYFDIEVGQYTGNWYINLWFDNISYIAEIGLRVSDGRFFALARSNCVHTPRMNYSPRTEQIWMKVTEEHDVSAHVVSRMTHYQSSKSRSPRIRKRTINITDEDIRRYYSNLSSLLRNIISSRISGAYGAKTGKFSFILEGESEEERRRLFSLLPKDFFMKRVLLGSSQELVIVGEKERPAGVFSGASDFMQGKVQPRAFFFELNTELIVYGRTEPGAQVWLGDKKIQLKGDGTFSLRLALDDGKLPLEFKAVSADGKETRRIETYIERNTKQI